MAEMDERVHATVQDVTWDGFEHTCRELANEIIAAPRQVASIVPILRGGMVPAALLSHMLGICISSVLDPQRVRPLDARVLASNILVVDEVCDTGATAKWARQYYPNALLVAPYVKPLGQPHCDFSIVEVEQDVWLRFPWEISLDRPLPLRL